MLKTDTVILKYQHQMFRPREAEALEILRKVASLVEPIMRRRRWKVKLLAEFYPPKESLMGLNWSRGDKICLRLRNPSEERKFLPMEYLVNIMLHELCHIVHVPHNEAFHTLWKELHYEHDQLVLWNLLRYDERLVTKSNSGEGLPSAKRRTSKDVFQRRAHALTKRCRTLIAGWGQRVKTTLASRDQDIQCGPGNSCKALREQNREDASKFGLQTKPRG